MAVARVQDQKVIIGDGTIIEYGVKKNVSFILAE